LVLGTTHLQCPGLAPVYDLVNSPIRILFQYLPSRCSLASTRCALNFSGPERRSLFVLRNMGERENRRFANIWNKQPPTRTDSP
jgi:hypothetical protein